MVFDEISTPPGENSLRLAGSINDCLSQVGRTGKIVFEELFYTNLSIPYE